MANLAIIVLVGVLVFAFRAQDGFVLAILVEHVQALFAPGGFRLIFGAAFRADFYAHSGC